jgi:hypothetical protein
MDEDNADYRQRLQNVRKNIAIFHHDPIQISPLHAAFRAEIQRHRVAAAGTNLPAAVDQPFQRVRVPK